MIIGIGMDLVESARMVPWLASGLTERFFHPDEAAACRARGPQAAQALAARFAAKEALGKALGTGLRGIRLQDIEVRSNEFGRPVFCLHGTAREAASRCSAVRIHLTLTHERTHAAAMVVIEGEPHEQ
ncbi:holo-ACP synthase [Spirochaeta africana]|uniref:Holo-[acyl-carrier-protein] synthase n=1 Tax=Spirochaeta africana (strain ATCC 700263 / DSM 8902 / Z-7692) TaxID=889378 RepID=H9UI19_SPIAZ|nr:holo-ACP synthase [Spirochaeta africana]AFG37162.1 holo-(acyl-carrier-protein) synthase [Spirochaeta africana DSM 8902]